MWELYIKWKLLKSNTTYFCISENGVFGIRLGNGHYGLWAYCWLLFFSKDTQMANVHEKVFNITNYERNKNQNYSETSTPHLSDKDPSCAVGGNVNECSHYGKQYGDPQKNE